MKVDALVVKRLDELIAKGKAISGAKVHDFTSREGRRISKSPVVTPRAGLPVCSAC
jgi:hypothetical protein